jgi:dGTPase
MNTYIRNRIFLEQLEEKNLALYAAKSSGLNTTRLINELEHDYRTAIQRDRDRIIHSRAFRRLKHKRQVFLISDGDHYRTRLTHTLEVSQLARTIAKVLGLNEELVEAIALGHDLGHTPFGHAGEVALNNILAGKDNLDGLLSSQNYGGFKHNYQSLRVVDKIERKYHFDGLNLTAIVREGILKHTRLLRSQYVYPDLQVKDIHFEIDCATSIEGQLVAICDEIAQRTHDLEDGIRAGCVELEQVRELDIVRHVEDQFPIQSILSHDRYEYRNAMIKGLINILVNDIIKTTAANIDKFYEINQRWTYFDTELVTFSHEIDPLQLSLDAFIRTEIIDRNNQTKTKSRTTEIIRTLFEKFVKNPNLLPAYVLSRLNPENKTLWPLIDHEKFIRAIADHIAGMTDNFAEYELNRLTSHHENTI